MSTRIPKFTLTLRVVERAKHSGISSVDHLIQQPRPSKLRPQCSVEVVILTALGDDSCRDQKGEISPEESCCRKTRLLFLVTQTVQLIKKKLLKLQNLPENLHIFKFTVVLK